MSKVKEMLYDNVNNIKDIEQTTDIKAFELILDWIALQVGINGVAYKSKIKTQEYLKCNLDISILRTEKKDVFGEVFSELSINSKNAINLIEYSEAKKRADTVKINKGNSFPKSVLDKGVGTGRTLMALSKKHHKNIVLYGIEKNITLFRICLINLALRDVSATVIYGNHTINSDTIDTSNQAWKYANNWNGNDKVSKSL